MGFLCFRQIRTPFEMIHVCTFGNEPQYTRSVTELCEEARTSGYFDTVTPYTQSVLPDEHIAFVQRNRRGYGYWLWKPIVLLETMRRANEGDVVIYADAGCAIQTHDDARKHFAEWIEAVKTHPTHRISFQMTHQEETWTKADVFRAMDCESEEYTHTGQHSASIQIYQVNSDNRAFLQELLRYMCMENYRLSTDAPSKLPNSKSFQEHRHDQSIRSLLCKKYGSHVYPDHWNNPSFPIVTMRRKYA